MATGRALGEAIKTTDLQEHNVVIKVREKEKRGKTPVERKAACLSDGCVLILQIPDLLELILLMLRLRAQALTFFACYLCFLGIRLTQLQ